MAYNTILLDKSDHIARLTLNRPERLNALNEEMFAELNHALEDVASDPDLRVFIITGAGRAFCSGRDLKERADDNAQGLQVDASPSMTKEPPFMWPKTWKPLIAAVNGFALAGGLELMMACDMALVADDARIGDQHVNFGLIPGGGSTQRLPRRVGLQRAMELLTTGKWLSGTEAVEWGLALRSAPAEGLDDELEKILGPLRTKSREGLALIKVTTLRGMGMSLEDGVALESRTFAQYLTTSPHPAEGIKAFIEKRTPEF